MVGWLVGWLVRCVRPWFAGLDPKPKRPRMMLLGPFLGRFGQLSRRLGRADVDGAGFGEVRDAARQVRDRARTQRR